MASSTERPGWLLKRAQDALNAAMTAVLREHGASLPEYAVLTALTANGRGTLAACHQVVDMVEDRMLAGLSPAERQQLAAGLRSCIDGLSAVLVSRG